jgi:hypothetical protein
VNNIPLSKPPGRQSLGSIVVRLRIAKSTATISFLCNNSASTLSTVESAAARTTIRIRGTGARDKLSARTISSALVVGPNSLSCSKLICICLLSQLSGCRGGSGFLLVLVSVAAGQGHSGIVIGLSIPKAASAITLLRNYGCGTFAGVEAAAGGCTISVGGAFTSDELRALSGDVERKAQEGGDFEDWCHCDVVIVE